MIQFHCGCGKLLQAREEHAGLEIACPGCGTRLAVPGQAYAIQEVPTLPTAPGPTAAPAPRREGGRRPRARETGPELSGKALASLICGGLTFLLPVLLAIPAVLLGILALVSIKRNPGRVSGMGFALAGLITGVLGNVTLLPYVWLYQGVSDRGAKRDSIHNLKVLGLAMHNYHSAYQHFPTPAIYSKQDGRPLLSWRVAILPFIEQQALYQQFKLDEPWDSPHNVRLLQIMPQYYAPVKGRGAGPSTTHYQLFTGPNTPFVEQDRVGPRLPMFADGTSNTILIAEADEAVPWTKPADMDVTPTRLPPLGGLWGNGFCCVMADGSVRFVDTRRVSPQTHRNAIDPQDGNPLGADWE